MRSTGIGFRGFFGDKNKRSSALDRFVPAFYWVLLGFCRASSLAERDRDLNELRSLITELNRV